MKRDIKTKEFRTDESWSESGYEVFDFIAIKKNSLLQYVVRCRYCEKHLDHITKTYPHTGPIFLFSYDHKCKAIQEIKGRVVINVESGDVGFIQID